MNSEVKRDVSKVSIGTLLYSIIVLFIVIIGFIFQGISEVFKNNGDISILDKEEFINKITNSGTSSIIAVIIGIGFLCLFFRRLNRDKLFETKRPMKMKRLINSIVCFIAVQMIFSVISYITEGTLNYFGYTMQSDIDSASSISTTVSMFLYASIIGPIAEEIVFRGFILKSLEKHGKILAILISSILFGVLHMNLIQGIFAAAVGIILGYVAIEYSIKWSILIHIINNFIFGDLLGYSVSRFSESAQTTIISIIEIVFFIGGIIITIKNRKEIKLYIKNNKTQNLKVAFSSVGFVICVIIMIILSLTGINKL